MVPFTAWPLAVQTGAPVVHEITPVWQEFPAGVQAVPVAHVTQLPPLQTWLVPHGVPSARLARLVHVDAPVEHEVTPALHAFPLAVQLAPAVQAAHVPEEQTLFVPHVVPSGAWVPVSVQTKLPPAQETVPTSHGLAAGTHPAPFVHAAHAPSLQYRLSPQDIPFGAVPPGVHTATPVEHAIVAA
jgi:hypothetical protein